MFIINNRADGDVQVKVGGVLIPVVIDSGASVNVIDREMWERFKSKKIKCQSKIAHKKVYSYGNTKPLTVAGTFVTDAKAGERAVEAEFIVAEEKGKDCLEKTHLKCWEFDIFILMMCII